MVAIQHCEREQWLSFKTRPFCGGETMGDNMTDQTQADILERLKQAEESLARIEERAAEAEKRAKMAEQRAKVAMQQAAEAEQMTMRRTEQAGILNDDGRSA